MFLPFLQIEVENEAAGGLTLALMALASVILPFNLFIMFMRKWGLEHFGMDRHSFNTRIKSFEKFMKSAHVVFSVLLVVMVTYHTYSAWGAAEVVVLHYAAIIGIYILFITGILALYVPLPHKIKRAMWKGHAKYVVFFIVVAIIGVAHLFIGD
jgi:hypothetical protein